MNLKVEVDGVQEIIQKLQNIQNVQIPQGVDSALNYIANTIIAVSKQKLTLDKISGGAVSNALNKLLDVSTKDSHSIQVFVDNNIAKSAEGVPYAFFVYYGTGNAYREGPLYGLHQAAKGWWIVTEDKLGSNTGYDKVITNSKGVNCYYFTGTQAIHFLEDAEKDTRGSNISLVANTISDYIKRGI